MVGEASNVNTSPRLTFHLVKEGVIKEPLRVIDVGSRGGFEDYWAAFGDKVSMIGFEPDAEECDRLNSKSGSSNRRYYPYAVSDRRGKQKFYVCDYPASSGFLRADEEFVSRFPDISNLAVSRETEIETTDIDAFLRAHNLGAPDFMKLDVEGAELLVLRGAERSLPDVLGLSIEVYYTRWREKAPTFPRVDSFLRPFGFELFDLTVNRVSRKVFGGQLPGPTRRGQAVWGQAIYLRDAVSELRSPQRPPTAKWDRERVLKLACVMEIFGLVDCAIELVRTARQDGLLESGETAEMLGLLYLQMTDQGLPRKSTAAGNVAARMVTRMPPSFKRRLKARVTSVRNILDGLLAV